MLWQGVVSFNPDFLEGAKLYDRRYYPVRIWLHGGGAGNAAGRDRGERGGRPQNRSGTRRTRNLILFRTGSDQPDFSGGITRSVIVNALRKFESAGIIESRSSGMKGTYIKVCNEFAYGEIRKMKEKK